MQNILHLCILICSWTIPKYAQAAHNGLGFQVKSLKLYNAPQSKQNLGQLPTRWATACPVSSQAEQRFEQNTSLDKKILFVRSIDDKGIGGCMCHEPVQISAAYHSKEKQLKFGYEIYYDETKYFGIELFSYKNMQSIKQYVSVLPAFKTFFQQIVPGNFVLINEDNGKTTKLRFVWVDRLSLQHDIKSWTPNIIRYQMLKSFPTTLRECDDYHLAEDYFESADLDTFYTKENELKILKDVDTSSFNIKCEPEVERCLTKWQLIPANQINYDPTGSNTCSNLTTVPIWINSTKQLLENLTIFLQATTRIVKNGLKIEILIEDLLLLPRTDGISPQPIYMHSEANKIPINDTLYYLIRHTVPNCNDPNLKCHRVIIIVIHNDPMFDKNKQICPQREDLCEKLGWDWIRDGYLGSEDSFKYDNFYCCEPVDPLISKFKSSQERDVEFGVLDLVEGGNNKTGGKAVNNLLGLILNEIQKMKEENNENSGPDGSSLKNRTGQKKTMAASSSSG